MGKVVVHEDADGQYFSVPPDFELPTGFAVEGDEAFVSREGDRLILTPATGAPSAED